MICLPDFPCSKNGRVPFCLIQTFSIRQRPSPMRHILTAILSLVLFSSRAQLPYFPPAVAGSAWATTAPSSLGWCADRIDSLYNYLGAHNTKAFIVLKDGRIVLEHYFGTFSQDSLWYWASAGKTLTSTVVGIAQQEGYLNIDSASSTYLGAGWTSETAAQEQQITVRNQLTMTSGLNDGVSNNACTTPSCLEYLAPAGTRWAYHTGVYALLQQVVANATGQTFQQYFAAKVRNPIGMDGTWTTLSGNPVYVSTVRSMARYGLLALNHMVWAGDTLLHDTAYFHAATTPSQSLNPSYGYLWWLNGQSSFMLPQTQIHFPGSLMPDAPADMYCGLGKNDQLLNVVPSRGLVLVRLGEAAQESVQVSAVFNNIIWQYMNQLDCTEGVAQVMPVQGCTLLPNPAKNTVRLVLPQGQIPQSIEVLDALGHTVLTASRATELELSTLTPGLYMVKTRTGSEQFISRLVKE